VSQPSQKRPLEEPSSPSAATDQPEAKRPALDKVIKADTSSEPARASTDVAAPESAVQPEQEVLRPIPSTQNGSGPTTAGASQGPKAITSSAHNDGLQTPDMGDESQWLHVRAIISNNEAATVIGRGGENVNMIRRMSGARCTVSDFVRGAIDRILTVSGLVDAVAKVLSLL